MFHNRHAGFGAVSGHNIDHTLRHARVGERADEVERGKRRILGRFDDAGVAADEGWEDLPRRNRHREIPRRDHPADADRLAHGHGELVRQLGRDGGPEQAAAFSSHKVAGVDGLLRVAAGFLDDLAHLAGHVTRVLFFTFKEHFRSAENDFSAVRRGDEAPLGVGALSGIDGSIDIGLAGALEDADNVTRVGRVAVFKSVAGS